MEIPVTGMVLCVIALLYRIWLQGHQRDQREHQQLLEQQTKPPKQDKQKKDQDKQKEIQNLLYEVSTELKDLDERLKVDDQFEAAAKEFTDLYKRTNFDWILDHKNYDSLDFKELANKTGEIYGALIKIPKLKIPIEKAAAKKKSEEEIRSKRVAEEAARKETIVETNPAPQPAAEGKDWRTRVSWRLVLPVFAFVAIAAGVFYGVKWKREFDSTDHLKNIGPGLYAPDAASDADLLPLDSGS